MHLDLWAANRLALVEAGVEHIEIAGISTAAHTDDWYSHRAENGKTGRMGALIALRRGVIMTDISSIEFQIKENLEIIQENIASAAKRGGRNSRDVKLITVSKKKSVAVMRAAVQAGITLFGENYPEETAGKMDILNQEYSDLSWHMIGHLQSRKVRLVAERFDMMHSLDSVRLANKLGRALDEAGRRLPVLLEMNVSGEESKGGWAAWDEKHWELLCAEIEQVAAIDSLVVKGLMTMPPLSAGCRKDAPVFCPPAAIARLAWKEIPADRLGRVVDGHEYGF